MKTSKLSISSNFTQHNEEVRRVWETYFARNPIRVPIVLGTNTRFYLLNNSSNPEHLTFHQYSEDPDCMFETQLKFENWSRHHLLQDAEMGMPKEHWNAFVDFQNYYEAAWFGAKVEYKPDQVPDTSPILTNDNKSMLFDKGIPDPFEDGIMKKLKRYHDYFHEKSKTYRYLGLPVQVNPPSGAEGSDGPLTIATNLRGTELYTDFYQDPEYIRQLLSLITDAIINRIKKWRKYLGKPEKSIGFALADDSIQMISTDMYKEYILPCHQKIFNECSEPGVRGMHLCGNVQRHLPTIVKELGIESFDTGFPIDFKWVREILGPDIEIKGGVKIMTLVSGTPEEIEKETREILESGILEGKRFILREANNLAPYTPLENCRTMYEAGKKYGTYE